MCIGSQTFVISRYIHPLQCTTLRMDTGVAEPCRWHTVCKILLYGYVNLLVSLQYPISWMHGIELFRNVSFDILNVRGHNFFWEGGGAVEIYCCKHLDHTTGITILCFISFHMNTPKNSFYARDLFGYLAPQFMVPEILKLSIPFICSKIIFSTTKCTDTIKVHILSPFLLHVSALIAPSSRRIFKCSKLSHFVITYSCIFHTITLTTIALGNQKTSPYRWRNKRRNMLENMW